MKDNGQQITIRWVCRCGFATFTIYEIAGGQFNLCVGDDLQVIGTYPSPTEAAIALGTRATKSSEWNKLLLDKDVPTKFRDWESEERE